MKISGPKIRHLRTDMELALLPPIILAIAEQR